ncbi:MAG: GNAT family N-acetyltransferase [Hamadaea sp.]|nr:GNAT family N-acetyltransferase [Hamadaea sp.]
MDSIVQRSVVAQLRRRPEVVETGPFVLGWDPSTESKYISYATPLPGAPITAADVAGLVAAFRSVGRLPRLEYVVSSAPDLERELLAAGFTVEARHDYLVCTSDSLAVPPVPEGFALVAPESDDDIRGMIQAQVEAFGDEFPVGDGDIARVRRTTSQGGVVIMARSRAGEPVGGGQASAPSAGLAEVGGIAVREPFRRRGLAGALTAEIARRAFAGGVEAAWLEASGDDSWRVYERVGFVPTGKRLYISLEP